MQPSPFFSSTPARPAQQQQQQQGQMPSGFVATGSYRGPGTPSGMQQVPQMPNGGMVRPPVPNMVAPHPGMQQQLYSQAQARQQFAAPQQQQQQGAVTPQRPTNVRPGGPTQTTPRMPGQGGMMQTPQRENQGTRTPVTDMKRSFSFQGNVTPQGQAIPQTEPRRGTNTALQHGKTSPPPPPPSGARAAGGNLKSSGSGGVVRDTPSKPVAAEKAPNPDDEIGHFQVVEGARIDFTPPFKNGRYSVVKQLGSGTYGKVILCEDHKYNRAGVAVKLVRREPPLYRVSAKNEIAILRELDGRSQTLKLLRDFEHTGHICMTFELLGDHLSEVLRRNGRPFRMEHVRDISFQLLQAVAYVHSKNIIHTDLKTENILLVNNPSGALSIKVVDFGSSLFANAWHPPLVGTMHYRAPEAVLQAGWSFPLDVWAIACLMVELVTGSHLFELAHDDVHLHMMERCLGPIPADLLRKGYANLNQYNTALLQRDARGAVRIAPCRMEGFQMVASMRRLKDMVSDPTLLDLMRQMLEYDPAKRITAQKALLHPFFNLADDDIDSIASPAISLTNDEAGSAGTRTGDRPASRGARAEQEGRKVLDFLIDVSEKQDGPATNGALLDASDPRRGSRSGMGPMSYPIASRPGADPMHYPMQKPPTSPGKENDRSDVKGYPLYKGNSGKEWVARDATVEDETNLLSSAPTPHEGSAYGASEAIM
mmetsp:Transcript_34653/g.80997  ORF Transcript_34653/g.80997 Transcript_34653/m.80997 type:complete len:708 (-) Transcript_34653:130-2253(-)